MAFSVGIDLGTTNTVVSTARKGINSNIEVITEAIDQVGEDGFSLVTSTLLPSVLYVDEGLPTVGLMAKAMKGQSNNKVIFNSKNYMGMNNYKWNIDSKEYSPEIVASYFLSAVRKHLIQKYKDEESLKSAVITVPASFNLDQRNATKNAARLAGFNNDIILISEPTSAILDFINEQSKIQDSDKVFDLSDFKNILVFDLGGGTCDVAILKIKITGSEVYVKEISVSEHTLIGGTNFDSYAVEGIIKDFEKENNISLDKELDESTLKNLKRKLIVQLEKAKIFFSAKYFQYNDGLRDIKDIEKTISLPIQVPNIINGNPFKMLLTMEKYNQYISTLLSDGKNENIITTINSTLESANFDKKDIDYIFCVGGMTKYPTVWNAITNYFEKEPLKFTDSMESVSRGAAIYHHYNINLITEDNNNLIKNNNDNIESISVERKIDITPTLPQTVFLNVKNDFPFPIINAKTEAGTPIILDDLIEVTSETGLSLELYSGMSRFDPNLKKLDNINLEFPVGIKVGTKVSLKIEYTKKCNLLFEASVKDRPDIKINLKIEGSQLDDSEITNLNQKYNINDVRGTI